MRRDAHTRPPPPGTGTARVASPILTGMHGMATARQQRRPLPTVRGAATGCQHLHQRRLHVIKRGHGVGEEGWAVRMRPQADAVANNEMWRFLVVEIATLGGRCVRDK
eukprot:107658-Chlamydomonas_euryale.AAC.6